MTVSQAMRIWGVIAVAILSSSPASAQTRSTRDTATAYGARLTADAEPVAANRRRINNRLDTRLSNRLRLRIERYTPTALVDPTVAYEASRDDGTRTNPTAGVVGISSRANRSTDGGIGTPTRPAEDVQENGERESALP